MRPALRDKGVYVTLRDRHGKQRTRSMTVYQVSVADLAKLIRKAIKDRTEPAEEKSAA